MAWAWSRQENDILVQAVPQLMGVLQPGGKTAIVRGLMTPLAPRSKAAVESKLMNVSGIFQRLGLPLVPGYAPMKKAQYDLFESMKRNGLLPVNAVLPPLVIPARAPKPAVAIPKPAVAIPKPAVAIPKPAVAIPKPAAAIQKPAVAIPKTMGSQAAFQGVTLVARSTGTARKHATGASCFQNVTFVPTSRSINRRAIRFAMKAERPEQRAFRKALFKYWKGRCPLTGISDVTLLEAAHRHGAKWKKGDNQVRHGILLCVDLHRLYDAGKLLISETGKVSLVEHLRHEPRYQGLHGKVIQGW